MDTDRRTFLKTLATAMGAITADPTAILDAAEAVSVTPAQAAAFSASSNALMELAGLSGMLHTGVYPGTAATMAVDEAAKPEKDRLAEMMSRAADGYKHWCENEIANAQGAPERLRRATSADAPYTPNPHGEISLQALEDMLARGDVRILQSGKQLHISAFNAELVKDMHRQLNMLFPDAAPAQASFGITIEHTPHALTSLARPYIADYPGNLAMGR